MSDVPIPKEYRRSLRLRDWYILGYREAATGQERRQDFELILRLHVGDGAWEAYQAGRQAAGASMQSKSAAEVFDVLQDIWEQREPAGEPEQGYHIHLDAELSSRIQALLEEDVD